MRPPLPVPHDDSMDDELVERFLEDGFVKIEGAFPPRVAQHCASLLWRETGYDPEDPASWKDPVVRVAGMAQGPFAAAANSPVLHEAFDLLVGENRWQPRYAIHSQCSGLQAGGEVHLRLATRSVAVSFRRSRTVRRGR